MHDEFLCSCPLSHPLSRYSIWQSMNIGITMKWLKSYFTLRMGPLFHIWQYIMFELLGRSCEYLSVVLFYYWFWSGLLFYVLYVFYGSDLLDMWVNVHELDKRCLTEWVNIAWILPQHFDSSFKFLHVFVFPFGLLRANYASKMNAACIIYFSICTSLDCFLV